jgi:DNA polymerase-1
VPPPGSWGAPPGRSGGSFSAALHPALTRPGSPETREQRHLAKALNFGLLYGMGAEGLRRYAQSEYGVAMMPEEAERRRQAFFAAYPGLATRRRRRP